MTRLLFPGLIGASALLHGFLLHSGRVGVSPTAPAAREIETTVILVEEQEEAPEMPPPVPEPEPLPEPRPILPPAPVEKEEVLSAPEAEAPPAPPPPKPPASPPLKPQKEIPKPMPAPRPAARAADVPRPVIVRNPAPRYPEFARRKGWEGRVVVRVSVDANGRPTQTAISKGSGYGVLDQAALQAVKTWRFRPRTLGGVPMAGTVDVPVNFSLRMP
jgi:protein TonB